jgi:GT2 family glycosyltransferase
LSDVDLIFFVDDDVEFLPGYFGLVRGCFRQEGVIGVGVSPLPNVRRNPSVVARLLGQDGLREGTVNRSGTNIGRFSGSGFAEWLPGCSMTYRRDAIGKVRFDERRGGYALGEDVDFGLRMHALGRLFWTSEPTIIHHQSPVNRLRRATLIRQSVRHKWTLAHDGLGNVSRHGVLLGVLGQAIFWLIRVLRWRSLEPLTYVRATLSGACDIARFGPIK